MENTMEETVYTVSLDPDTRQSCTIRFFTDVKNTQEIRKKVTNGEVNCAVVKAGLIVDPFQIVVAANKAALNSRANQLTTKSLYTEILFCLSTSKNISRSLQEFGIHDDDKNVLFVLVRTNDEPESKNIVDIVEGVETPFSRLSEFTDYDLVRKTYKIDKEELKISSYVDSIVSRISCKDFSSTK